MKPTSPRTRLHEQSGFTLLEVLVAILICSLGLLGILGLQARALQFSVSAEDSNRAALLANELASAMLTSKTTTLPAATLTTWQARVGDPAVGPVNGAGNVVVSDGVATITITWRATNSASGVANSQNRYITQVVIPS